MSRIIVYFIPVTLENITFVIQEGSPQLAYPAVKFSTKFMIIDSPKLVKAPYLDGTINLKVLRKRHSSLVRYYGRNSDRFLMLHDFYELVSLDPKEAVLDKAALL